jgi:uncharacterized membrane protein YbaN (DUF454 family)
MPKIDIVVVKLFRRFVALGIGMTLFILGLFGMVFPVVPGIPFFLLGLLVIIKVTVNYDARVPLIKFLEKHRLSKRYLVPHLEKVFVHLPH